jgi:hypothetical protein
LDIVEDTRKTHQDILKAIEGLSAQQLGTVNSIGKWSARDVVLHLAMWVGECLKGLSVWKTGHSYDWEYAKEYLAFNDFWVKSCAHLTPEQVIQVLNLNYLALANELAAIPPEIWQKRAGAPNWLKEIAIVHSQSHVEKLSDYRNKILHKISI